MRVTAVLVWVMSWLVTGWRKGMRHASHFVCAAWRPACHGGGATTDPVGDCAPATCSAFFTVPQPFHHAPRHLRGLEVSICIHPSMLAIVEACTGGLLTHRAPAFLTHSGPWSFCASSLLNLTRTAAIIVFLHFLFGELPTAWNNPKHIKYSSQSKDSITLQRVHLVGSLVSKDKGTAMARDFFFFPVFLCKMVTWLQSLTEPQLVIFCISLKSWTQFFSNPLDFLYLFFKALQCLPIPQYDPP